MKLIVGLGNPGEKYKDTRHNIGFIFVDKLSDENDVAWKFEKKFNAEIARFDDTLLAKPQTFMNNSGESVSKIMNFYDIELEDLLVVHDDIDLEHGNIKVEKGRGSAGHKGVQSIIDHLGTNEFERMRIGVGRPDNPNIETEDWVLMNFDYSNIIDFPTV